jgi:hypothetical protein
MVCIFVIIGAVLALFCSLTPRSRNEQIKFTIVNADTGEPMTNVTVTAYRPYGGLLKELRELDLIDGPLVRVEALQVRSGGVVETEAPSRGKWATIYFTPETNFATVIFNRNDAGDSFSSPGKLSPKQGRTNQITIALQRRMKEGAKP